MKQFVTLLSLIVFFGPVQARGPFDVQLGSKLDPVSYKQVDIRNYAVKKSKLKCPTGRYFLRSDINDSPFQVVTERNIIVCVISGKIQSYTTFVRAYVLTKNIKTNNGFREEIEQEGSLSQDGTEVYKVGNRTFLAKSPGQFELCDKKNPSLPFVPGHAVQ